MGNKTCFQIEEFTIHMLYERVETMLKNKNEPLNWKDEVILVHASVRKEEQTIQDIQFWQRLNDQTRFAAAWQLAKEVYLLRGKSEGDLRMDRSRGRVTHRTQAEE